MNDKAPLRIAIVGLSIEVMLASPISTDATSVTRYESNDILCGDLWLIRGMLDRLSRDGDVDVLPLCWAKALPGGPLARETYDAIKADTIARLERAGRLDGLLVANHGALEVAGLGVDADTDFIEALRTAIGPDLPMSVALDLHGDMTPGFLAAATTFSVLRTAPHRDDRETGHRAADQLVHIIRNQIRPSKAAVRIPVIATGETAMTTFAPAGDLYASLADYDKRPGIIEANILVGFAWNDLPWAGMTAIAVSDADAETARTAALDLAADIWRRRSEFGLHMETAEVGEGLLRAVEAPERPAFVSDSGDNTTAGASGDLTLVLQAALADPRINDVVVAGIRAPQTVAQLITAGVGAEVEIVLGAEHISRPRTECRVTARVEAFGRSLELPEHQPASSEDESWVCVRIGGTLATFHANRVGITSPAHFAAMGIHPTAHKVYVVKLGYLYPELEDIAARFILLLSDGVSQLDLTRLHWSEISRPIHPLDPDFEWSPRNGLYGD